jgi:hypothetical protein
VKIEGIDFGPGADLQDVIRRRMAGQIHVTDDPHDPTLQAWLGRAYQRLRSAGEHEPLGQAFAALIADDSVLVREAVAWFLRAWPDDPAAADAARTAMTKHRALYAGFPDTLGGSPAGLEGELLGAVGKTIADASDPMLEVLREAAVKPEMLGPCLPALATHDPLFLIRHAADLGASSPYWLRTFLGILDKPQLPMRTRWIAPRSDVVARIARAGNAALAEAIERGVAQAQERAALRALASDPGEIGAYDASPSDGLELAALRARCLQEGGCDGAVLSALGGSDPGFAARALTKVLRATPGALGPLLAWGSRHGLDMGQTARRVRATYLYPRDQFLAVAMASVDSKHLAAIETAWPAGT